MSALRDIMIERMIGDMSKIFTFKNGVTKTPQELLDIAIPKIEAAESEVKDLVLNLIEQSKDKSLPLTWLTGEIKKL
jgi:hypothetical protein